MTKVATNRLTSVALILLASVALICIMLGRWQLERAEQRRAIAVTIEAGRRAPPLSLLPTMTADTLIAWRAATAQGRWRPEWSVLLDNRNLDGKPGLWLATPLMLDDNSAVLVLRGWLERPIANKAPLKVPTNTGIEKVEGELAVRVPRLFELWSSQPDEETSLPIGWKGIEQKDPALIDTADLPRLQNLDLQTYAQRTGLVLLSTVLLQKSEGGADGLKRVWPEPSLDADKNVGYAMQWFGFAGIVIIAFIVVLWRRLRRRK